ncbi:MAG: D-Ala-D-Ala carboxypeptidase Serine peptidase family [Nitrosospira multiformis]|jgi:D-alanyl-D-alanine carboxypeptidase/D-alanyl-D-alanine-endopeptidase (penicillin-binding protein 4)|nr:D-Ala-D-Ala carboxypeptidase Serine peptidase family [Nitrosospira multiformis]
MSLFPLLENSLENPQKNLTGNSTGNPLRTSHRVPLSRAVKWALCSLLVFLPLPGLALDLPDSVKYALARAGIPRSAVGIYVHETGAGQPLLAINAGVGMSPASVMKLLTTFAGLELLGPGYAWKTELYADGIVRDDALHGNLVIKGYGDPRLNLENFWLLTRRLRQTGLREITGDLVLDSSHFDLPGSDSAAFDGKPYRAYNVLPEALMVNYRTLALRLLPQPESRSVRIVVDPLLPSLDLKNSLTLTSGACNDWKDALGTDIQSGLDSRVSVTLKGSYAFGCGEKTLFLSVHDTARYTFDLFRQLWEQQGGVLRGSVRRSATPGGTVPLETHQSPPLADIVRDINKFSNNTAARQLYLTLGLGSEPLREPQVMPASFSISYGNGGAPENGPIPSLDGTGESSIQARATLARSEKAVREWLASRQLVFPELILENGSGLSRNERISAGHMGKLLLAAFQSHVMPEFVSSLPIVAVDGTMKKRLNRSAVAGQAHIKTGLLEGVKTIAGYVRDKSGRRSVVVFFINHPRAEGGQAAMDALLDWVYEGR